MQVFNNVFYITGPATVRMVSTNSSPPIPLPVQVPPGHVVQQVVDEHGTLQHLILSTQPLTMPMYPCVSTPLKILYYLISLYILRQTFLTWKKWFVRIGYYVSIPKFLSWFRNDWIESA